MNEKKNAPYAVIACRWGWLNNGFAVIGVCADFDKAKQDADEYADYRGGKYGVGVFDANGKQIYHASSLYGETELHTNHRIEAFESVGCFVYCRMEDGKELEIDKIKDRYNEAVIVQDMMQRLDTKNPASSH